MTDSTIIEALIVALQKARHFHRGTEEAPVALLWADPEGQWQSIIDLLQTKLPELFVFGTYNPEKRQGPAIWLKCIVARTLEVGLKEDAIPVIYLPGVGRQLLRAAGDCPTDLQPLVELQYRGSVWTQRNGKDWTLEAFFSSQDGLGLDLALDEETRSSLRAALPQLANLPIETLHGRRLEADDLDRLMVGDEKRDLLLWIGSPDECQQSWTAPHWQAFVARCKREYGFDPLADGPVVAAERLGRQEKDAWHELWRRFCEAPESYPGIAKALSMAKPANLLLFDREPWPTENEAAENALRDALKDLGALDEAAVLARVLELEKEHGCRRKWVWERLGKCELARGLEGLAQIAGLVGRGFPSSSVEEFAGAYTERGFEVDAAALRVGECGRKGEDVDALRVALRAIYLPWLRTSAERFQELLTRGHYPAALIESLVTADGGECILFVDGLRFDLGQRLRGQLEGQGFKVSSSWRWAAFPTVTATAKPFVSPIKKLLVGNPETPEGFCPIVRGGGDPVTTQRFRKLLSEHGYEIVEHDSNGVPQGRGWCEVGKIDSHGHELKGDLVRYLGDELDRVAERIERLLRAGWRKVKVVTDHGWLLMPGGLPKVELPSYLTQSRWSRCACIRPGARVSLPSSSWSWNDQVQLASAPGIAVFEAGVEYAHGGLSPQECIVPYFEVTGGIAANSVVVRIREITWRGLRCRIWVEPAINGLAVDIRTKPMLAASSVADVVKTTDADGHVSLLIPHEDRLGTAAVVVVLDANGGVVAKDNTIIGEE